MMQATALVAFLMAAFLSFPMVMRAHMSLAVVMATVTFAALTVSKSADTLRPEVSL